MSPHIENGIVILRIDLAQFLRTSKFGLYDIRVEEFDAFIVS